MREMEEFRNIDNNVIFAPEGFVDQQYVPILKNKGVNIIEIRYLADGPVIHSRHSQMLS